MVPIITVTGTKGKSSIVRALDAVLAAERRNVLRVDTEGAWLNGERQYSHDDSKRVWGLAPANAPGRFMTLLGKNTEKSVAILEANLFCSKQCGLGYSAHSVGVFTNVYDDHKGADPSLQSRKDIANAKSFVFSRIADGGYAVFNADDIEVVQQLSKLPRTKRVTRVACSVQRSSAPADVYVYTNEDMLVIEANGVINTYGKIPDYGLVLSGFIPTVYNLLLVTGALYGYFDGQIPSTAIEALKQYTPDDIGGRLCVYRTNDDKIVIFDFAHETISLKNIAKLAKQLAPQGKVVGVLRLSPTRTDSLIKETADAIKSSYDSFYIYDKIDGIHRHPDHSLNPFKTEVVGKTARTFAKYLKKAGAEDVHTVISEDEAASEATAALNSGDVLVYIQGNNPRTSLKILQRLFGKDNLIRIKP